MSSTTLDSSASLSVQSSSVFKDAKAAVESVFEDPVVKTAAKIKLTEMALKGMGSAITAAGQTIAAFPAETFAIATIAAPVITLGTMIACDIQHDKLQEIDKRMDAQTLKEQQEIAQIKSDHSQGLISDKEEDKRITEICNRSIEQINSIKKEIDATGPCVIC